jgi:hypothetical protein
LLVELFGAKTAAGVADLFEPFLAACRVIHRTSLHRDGSRPVQRPNPKHDPKRVVDERFVAADELLEPSIGVFVIDRR